MISFDIFIRLPQSRSSAFNKMIKHCYKISFSCFPGVTIIAAAVLLDISILKHGPVDSSLFK